MFLSTINSSHTGTRLCSRLSCSGPYFGHMYPGGMTVLTRIPFHFSCNIFVVVEWQPEPQLHMASLASIRRQMSMSCSQQYEFHKKKKGAARTTQGKWHQEPGVFLYCFHSADLLETELGYNQGKLCSPNPHSYHSHENLGEGQSIRVAQNYLIMSLRASMQQDQCSVRTVSVTNAYVAQRWQKLHGTCFQTWQRHKSTHIYGHICHLRGQLFYSLGPWA